MSDEIYVQIYHELYDDYYHKYRIYIDKDIDDPDKYRELFNKLESETKSETIFQFIINTYGGNLNTTIQLIDYIKNTKAQTEAVIYQAISAGSLVALSCNKINPRPNAVMMIHNLQHWNSKQQDINKHKWVVDFYVKVIERLFHDIYKGFLSDEEISKVINEGYEFWMFREEIIKRAKKAGLDVISDE